MSNTKAPNIGWAHAVLTLGGFAIGTTEFATMSFLPAFTAELGVDAPTGGHVVSAYALGVVVGAPMLAMFGAGVERRRWIALLLSWFALGNLLSAFAPSIEILAALRFLTAIPHGAYFGTAVLMATGLVEAPMRATAVGRVLMGLAAATVVGVPLASLLAQWLGWRVGFATIGVLCFAVVGLLLRMLPRQQVAAGASARRELGALGRRQVWLSLGIGAVGFGGLFAVYTYLTSTLLEVTHVSDAAVPVILAIFGAGMAFGNFVAPRLARRGVMRAAGLMLAWSAVALAVYPSTIANVWLIGLSVFAIGCGGGLGTLLQMRLMDVAGDAQSLAASMNHAAFNLANALGPWFGGLTIAAGHGWASTGWVGCLLTLGGLTVWIVSVATDAPSVRLAGSGTAND